MKSTNRYRSCGPLGARVTPHSQRRASTYITNTTDTAMADPSTIKKTNDGIAPNSALSSL
jgi:hypothetical protein